MTAVVTKNKVVSLIFEVAVQDIRDATPEEIRDGRPAGDLPALQ